MRKSLIFLLVLISLVPIVASARIGVGLGIGKIKISQPLRPGKIYKISSLPIFNTGDEISNYELVIRYHQGQEARSDMGLRPAKEWFIFQSKSFSLEPGEVKKIIVKLDLPSKTKPGNYFAYLEAYPLIENKNSNNSIKIAAAAKLYFTVIPANIFQKVYYQINSFLTLYKHFVWIITIIAIIIIVLIIFRRYFFHLVKKRRMS